MRYMCEKRGKSEYLWKKHLNTIVNDISLKYSILQLLRIILNHFSFFLLRFSSSLLLSDDVDIKNASILDWQNDCQGDIGPIPPSQWYRLKTAEIDEVTCPGQG